MASRFFRFSFVQVICGLKYFPIICKCWISYAKLNIYFVKLEWLLKILNFKLQKLILVSKSFPPFIDVGYELDVYFVELE
jgi:hypothetical protein